MFKDKLNNVKQLIETGGENADKRKIENLVVFVIIIIVTLLVINMVWKNDNKKEVTKTSYTELASSENENNEISGNISVMNEYNLGKSLEDILCKISGAGKVKVLLTYSESSQVVPVSNEKYKETQTEETDKNGGTRIIKETDKTGEAVYEEKSGQKEILTQKVIMPKIEGALVLAEGANNATTKTNIIQAVEAVTGLATHKIQVLQLEN